MNVFHTHQNTIKKKMILVLVAGEVYLMQLSTFLLLLLSVSMVLCPCDARSTINGTSKLVDNGETLISVGGKFAMGFFSDDEGLNRYVVNTYVILKTGSESPIWKGSVPLGTSGSFKFNEMPTYVTYLLSNFTESDIGDHSVEATVTSFNYTSPKYTRIDFSSIVDANHSVKDSIFENTRILMNSSGEIQFYFWNNESGWSLIWSAPKDICDEYKRCGKFGICNSNRVPVCKCLSGFEPDTQENYGGEFSGGCSRMPVSSCKEDNVEPLDTFLDLKSMKFGSPDLINVTIETHEECSRFCLGNCTCQAYTYHNSGCWIWFSNLYNLQENYTGGFDLAIRIGMPHIEVAKPGPLNTTKASSRNQRALVISISLILGVVILCGISYIIYQTRRTAKSKETREIILGKPMEYLPHRDSSDEVLITELEKKRIDVPFFSLNSILVATENFSNASKLGRGGFGPVYKGKFLGGTEMAVKRLSSNSGQGVEEFKTEVMLIAKLQHRNLVRLLGYCIEGNEKILLYEYMPNKSLDTFLFDHAFCRLLDWRIRFEIILGVARGLLYLHQDSRLRIIHRDLKTSNILLDDEMNAKISDFGLARIIEGKSTEANTNKVVGTYGYMSPEYALEGLFSIKSDVFAFGVVLLEIISGKRNMELFEDVNLIGYVWRLWMKDRAIDMMDQTIFESCDVNEVIKCVNVALLCVQEDPAERPVMSNVVFMLGGESMTLPRPNQPAFITRRNSAGASTSSSSSKLYSTSNNALTITQEEGR
ncbi:hypothetical protein P3L10_021254 [Capsicum annuum]